MLKHGQSRTSLYSRWSDMKTRCLNSEHPRYKYWGGRGITVFPSWASSDGFIAFAEYIKTLGPCPRGYSLDRIENNGNYEPGNLRWASAKMQRANSRPKRDKKLMGLLFRLDRAIKMC